MRPPALHIAVIYQWIAAEADHGPDLVGPSGQNGLINVASLNVPRISRVARADDPSNRAVLPPSPAQEVEALRPARWAVSRSAHCRHAASNWPVKAYRQHTARLICMALLCISRPVQEK